MGLVAIIDATKLHPESPAIQIAGLSLLERALRLVEVIGASSISVWANEDQELPELQDIQRGLPVQRLVPKESVDVGADVSGLVVLDASIVYERSGVQRIVGDLSEIPVGRDPSGHLVALGAPELSQRGFDRERYLDLREQAAPILRLGWSISIETADDARRAARRLWRSCRKAEDGLVARYLNRHISIAISKILASTAVRPNHVTGLTFVLGVAAAVAAGWGGYLGFLTAGLLYQANSVIDGVDGELARVRYEFSVRGEWLDTISDDLADLFIYLGIGVGAWRTLPDAPGPLGSEFWLILGLIAAASKIASMALYYRWLIARGRGDLLAFQWSFEDGNQERSPLDRLLSASRYLFRKDFIVFTAMVMSVVGLLPYLLLALAPGNLIVAFSVLLQQLRSGDPQL